MSEQVTISVIIPTHNEQENIRELLPVLTKDPSGLVLEILVVDAHSTDHTARVATEFGAKVIASPRLSRAYQLNLGAQNASGQVLYFLHADVRPFRKFAEVISESIQKGKSPGCFSYQFDSSSQMLQLNSWFTQFNGVFAGGGDQSLFIEKELFFLLGGYDEKFCVMEDFDLVRRIRQKTDFHVLPHKLTVSARKYVHAGWLRVQVANLIAFSLFLLKIKPASIKSLYLKLLK
ncbi:TIGR04283 family arsenosugar biosynthesis glycosyltransferase [Algoriphagus halophytocola]|uniref:TIGR04283 family arsenosugar biosynthesis glycosyltransferase n=1 Tax=Algoriphagus halophytocola TaxID=2991499 RepID=A0ABY6MHA3_9BACT|nr:MULTISPECIES: TIGR04283 family arsenosugar biosynthesis glycosyltransferase [unclassified Algoriphagus]UZD23165.1 TIGR04283 family arsenosugar biosynthesis glycosyltransferase [Algoriphagus sp. TR-M5]WBL44457.1 TIGR04283 family arsenosugar biosynthesis glycosyltransferase [Algoriphagus sp. TR-M9]